jgi:hypothetical protein
VTVPVSPGQLNLIDTSAHARSDHPAVRRVIAGLIGDRVAATCVTVDLEAGYSGRDAADAKIIAERRRRGRPADRRGGRAPRRRGAALRRRLRAHRLTSTARAAVRWR